MITHYLSIQCCNRVFYDSDFGVMCCVDAIKNPSQFGLEPLYVMGVTHADFALSQIHYFHKDNPSSITELLTTFWEKTFTNDMNIKVSGYPDLLMIDRRCKGVINPKVLQWLDENNVKYEFDKRGKWKLPTKCLTFQKYPHKISSLKNGIKEKPIPTEALVFPEAEPYPLTLERLNTLYHHNPCFHVHNLPQKKRNLFLEMYSKGVECKIFTGKPLNLINEVDFDKAELKVNLKKTTFALSVSWSPAVPKERYNPDTHSGRDCAKYGSLVIERTQHKECALIDFSEFGEESYEEDSEMKQILRICLKAGLYEKWVEERIFIIRNNDYSCSYLVEAIFDYLNGEKISRDNYYSLLYLAGINICDPKIFPNFITMCMLEDICITACYDLSPLEAYEAKVLLEQHYINKQDIVEIVGSPEVTDRQFRFFVMYAPRARKKLGYFKCARGSKNGKLLTQKCLNYYTMHIEDDNDYLRTQLAFSILDAESLDKLIPDFK